MNTLFVILSTFVLTSPHQASAATHKADRAEVHPIYEWFTVLDKDTKAALGPIEAAQILKIRFDRIHDAESENVFSAMEPEDAELEKISVCINEHDQPSPKGAARHNDCEMIAVPDDAQADAAGPEFSLSARPTKVYLTIQRAKPVNAKALTLSVKIFKKSVKQ